MSSATYCPEDNKLRLYCGRVDRPEYDRLRAEGWKALHKQREAGGGDFVTTWTPERYATALQYGEGIVEDEDMGPEERAADRAERFEGYREKRTGEATGHAERFEGQPAAHGFQSPARAERAAARHDRIGDKAVDAWSRAEYWQSRTAGVIAHALYVSSPDVRMGRIKTLEADLRRLESRTDARGIQWADHLRLRLAYESQMLEAQGGRAAHVEMEAGGRLGNRRIHKVNKSPATGRVTSVLIEGPRCQGWTYKAHNPPGVDYGLYQIDTERLPADAYTPPTDAERAEWAEVKKAKKAAAPKGATIPLVNPTDADAARLQALWNEIARAYIEKRSKESSGWKLDDFKPSEVLRITQATYSAHSKGSYCSASTRGVFPGGFEQALYYGAAEKMREKHGREVCLVRRANAGSYQASRVIVLTDKPQKALPASVWQAVAPAPTPAPVVMQTALQTAEKAPDVMRTALQADLFAA